MNHRLSRLVLLSGLLHGGILSAQTTINTFGGTGIGLNAPGAPYTFTVSTGTATQSGAITESGGSFGFTKDGAGTLILSGANTYTSSTGIADGTLQVGTTGALGTGAVYVGATGTLNLTGGTHTVAQVVFNENEEANGPNPYLTLSGGAVLTSTGGVADSMYYSQQAVLITGAGSRLIAPQFGAGGGQLTLADQGVLQLSSTSLSIASLDIGAIASASAVGGGYLSLGSGNQTVFGDVQFNHTATSANPYWFTSDGTAGGTGVSVIGGITQTAGVTVVKNVSANSSGTVTVNGGEIRFTGTGTHNITQVNINGGTAAFAAVPNPTLLMTLNLNGGVFQATETMTFQPATTFEFATNYGTIINVSGTNNAFRVDAGKTLTLGVDRSDYLYIFNDAALPAVQSLRGTGAVTKDGGGTLVLERGMSQSRIELQDFTVRAGTVRVYDYIFRDMTIGKLAGDDGYFSLSGTNPGNLRRIGVLTNLGFYYANYWTPQTWGTSTILTELDGMGAFTIPNGGVAQSRSLTLGQQAGSTGSLVMNEKDSGGWFVDNGLAIIGGAGTGHVTLANHFLYNKGQDIILGQSAGGVGYINASGANAQINSGVDLTPLDVFNTYANPVIGYSGNPLAHGVANVIIGQGGTGHVTLTNNARLLAGQTFIGAGSDLTLGSGGTVYGGFTAQNGSTVHALDDATFAFTLGTVTEASSFEAGSTFLVDDNADLIFAITQGTGFGLGTYTLFTFAGGTTLTGLDGANFAATGLGGYGYAFDLTGTQLNLTVSAIPEPSAYAMLAGALALGFVIVRGRKRAL